MKITARLIALPLAGLALITLPATLFAAPARTSASSAQAAFPGAVGWAAATPGGGGASSA
ncbi:hypothetical protein ACFSUK_31240 [Sphingobium scionense]